VGNGKIRFATMPTGKTPNQLETNRVTKVGSKMRSFENSASIYCRLRERVHGIK